MIRLRTDELQVVGAVAPIDQQKSRSGRGRTGSSAGVPDGLSLPRGVHVDLGEGTGPRADLVGYFPPSAQSGRECSWGLFLVTHAR